MPTRTQIYNPCKSDRPVTDIAGRVNDLVNCYIIAIQDRVRQNLPVVILYFVLIAIMLFAAYKLIKD